MLDRLPVPLQQVVATFLDVPGFWRLVCTSCALGRTLDVLKDDRRFMLFVSDGGYIAREQRGKLKQFRKQARQEAAPSGPPWAERACHTYHLSSLLRFLLHPTCDVSVRETTVGAVPWRYRNYASLSHDYWFVPDAVHLLAFTAEFAENPARSPEEKCARYDLLMKPEPWDWRVYKTDIENRLYQRLKDKFQF
jgi:hypothetical protein